MLRPGVLLLTFICSLLWTCQKTELPKEHAWSLKDRDLLIHGLSSTRDSLLKLTETLSNTQWQFQENPNRWNIGQVVTHLSIHDALFYREIRSTTSLQEPSKIPDSLLDQDRYLLDYAEITEGNSGESPWYLQPDTRWCDQTATMAGYISTRNAHIQFIEETGTNLRAYYSSNGRGHKQFRDLHQLTLVSIAHSKRHLMQIIKIKSHPDFPKQ